ncbi:OmpA family protein [Ulvibacter antarcticus]|uniref:Outer membrane protein OmpA-like peptidoglycan-associated protein n=1 Tax=Ulvibacter antarcticus TaxID=442714 RepID=A0A3L9ZDI4_9FLAO|nr:OmpA family protein [Ulvibacter antarcticus]RMA64722.1 outer membrane protein OmpA-like peptidoglycan-associated protein [Ulvibacter antarcticus]
MKYFSILILFIGFTVVSHAQADLKRANKYFENAYYFEAIPLYESIVKKNNASEVVQKLADSYYNTGNFKAASRWYRYLSNKFGNDLEETALFKYVQTLKAIESYEDAYTVQRNVFKVNNDSEGLKKLDDEIKYLENVKGMGDRFSMENLKINTEQSEFGMIEFGDQVIFAAPSKEKGLLDFKYHWNGEGYLDLYTASKDSLKFGNSVAVGFSEKINTKLHEANAIFTKDGNTIYFTRNYYINGKKSKDENDVLHVELFKAQLIDGKWSNIEVLPFNGNNFSIEHPALSTDEKTLYFASDMPGTIGSFDIFKVDVHENGTYGAPVNLGNTINTKHREQFPYISEKGKLYYSSDGLPGFGALDVFVSEEKNGSFSKPDNVGFPINSGFDDFSFNINERTKEGYFASNRPGGKGKDDIYKIKETKDLKIEDCGQFIAGIISDAVTKEPLANVALNVLDNDNNATIIATFTSDENGAFKLPANCELTIEVNASKVGYQDKSRTIFLGKQRGMVNDASMELISLESIRKKEDAERLAEEKLKLENEKDRVKNIINSEREIVKRDDKLLIKVEDMRFDYNLWYMRKDSKKISNKVIAIMKKYPSMIVEIGTHTDIRGSASYNANLSQKRANSVLDYFLEQGVESSRISAKGYGESDPIVSCATEEACDEEQHEVNRRCEFVIKRM